MPSPFPGMDPYLEALDIWPDFQGSLTREMSPNLNSLLPSPYYARLRRRPEQATVEIRDPGNAHQLVTLIALLSPSSKRPGIDRRACIQTQREVLEDLLDAPCALRWLCSRPQIRFRSLVGLSPFTAAWIDAGGDEPGRLAHQHGLLPHPPRHVFDGLECRGRALERLDDLDQLHLVDGIEEVHPGHAGRVLQRAGELGHAKGRCIGSDHGACRRVLFDPRAKAWDDPDLGAEREFRRKVRTLTGNYQLLQIAPWLLRSENPLRFEFISHKLMRLLGPFALMVLLLSSLFAAGTFYRTVFWIQIACYLLSLLGATRLKLGLISRITDAAWTFVLLNAAAVIAFWNFVTGHTTVWMPEPVRKEMRA